MQKNLDTLLTLTIKQKSTINDEVLIKDEDRSLLKNYIVETYTDLEITAGIKADKIQEWYTEYLLSSIEIGQAEPVTIEGTHSVVDSTIDSDVIPLDETQLDSHDRKEHTPIKLYDPKLPTTHQPVPVSILGLPIFSTEKGLISEIDQKNFRELVKQLNLRIEEPTLDGEILDPILDSRIIREIFKTLRNEGYEAFEVRDMDTGVVIQDGKMITINYFDLIFRIRQTIDGSEEMNAQDRYNAKRKEVVKSIENALARIKALRMRYKKHGKHEFPEFFPHLKLDPENYTIMVKASGLVWDLFKDDRILTLNPAIMNVANNNAQSSIIHYISGLKHHYNKQSQKGKGLKIINDISLSELVIRCYPSIPSAQLAQDYDRRKVVNTAMESIKNKGLIQFQRGKDHSGRIIFTDVICFTSLTNEEYQKWQSVMPRNETGNTFAHYILKYPLPNLRNKKEKDKTDLQTEYVLKHAESMIALLAHNSELELKKAAVGVRGRTLDILVGYCEVIDDSKAEALLNLLNSVKSVRLNKTS